MRTSVHQGFQAFLRHLYPSCVCFLALLAVEQQTAQEKEEAQAVAAVYVPPTPAELKAMFPETADKYPRISEADFLAKIAKGKSFEKATIPAKLIEDALCRPESEVNGAMSVDLDSCFIEGALNLSEKHMTVTFLVNNSNFPEGIVMDGATLDADFRLEDCQIGNWSSLKLASKVGFSIEQSRFGPDPDSIAFTDSTFALGASFERTVFTDSEGAVNQTFDCRGCVFGSKVSFDGAGLQVEVDLRGAQFKGIASFENAKFHGYTDFGKAIFYDSASFKHASFANEMDFVRTTFKGPALFDRLTSFAEPPANKQPSLIFRGTVFEELVSLRMARLASIDMRSEVRFRGRWTNILPPVRCLKGISFHGAHCDVAHLENVEFYGRADFGGAEFSRVLSLNQSSFKERVNFLNTNLPRLESTNTKSTNGLHLDGTVMLSGANLTWDQLSPALSDQEIDTWVMLESTFDKAGDLPGKNHATYQRRLAEKQDLATSFSRVFWGYGLRPLRVVGWWLAFHILCTFSYWTQTTSMASSGKRITWFFDRLKVAVDFGFKTAKDLKYAFKQSRTRAFQVITLTHAIGTKVFLFFLFVCLSNVSPLLHDLAGKILPFS